MPSRKEPGAKNAKLASADGVAAPPPKRPRPVWRMLGSAGTLGSGQWILRQEGEGTLSDAVERRLVSGQAMSPGEWPAPPPRFTYEKVGSVPDVANSASRGPYIVSGRLREFLEHHAPGACEFLPVRVDGPGRAALHADYWCVNFLRAWECQPDPDMPEVDPGSIPTGERLGVVAGSHWFIGGHVICVDEFKRLAEREKFVGLRFEKMHLATGPSGLVPYRDPVTGARMMIERRCVPSDHEFDVDAFLARFPNGSYRSPTPNSSALHEYVMMHSVMGGVDVDVLRKLLDAGGDVNADGDKPNLDPLLVSIQPKSPEIIRLLHERGADWSVQNIAGLCPLMSAAMGADVAAVRELLSCGARADQRNSWGRTALHEVCERPPMNERQASDAEEVAALLVEAGADAGARDEKGQTALDLIDLWLRQEHLNCRDGTLRLRATIARLSGVTTPPPEPKPRRRARAPKPTPKPGSA